VRIVKNDDLMSDAMTDAPPVELASTEIVIDKARISERNEKLEQARDELKEKFVGIDAVVDELIDAIRIWFLMPEVLSRPVIINLWGMTGVGKTDLVRRLVRAIDFQERFAEVELSNSDSTSYQSSVSSILDSNNINDDKPSIVLFDEIQRFNTLSGDGSPVQSTKFTDFWELLSDGRLAKRSRDDLDYSIQDATFYLRDLKKRKDAGEEGVNPDEGIGIWEARSLKSRLNLDKPVDELAEISRTQMIELLRDAKKRKVVYEPVNHSKTLCIISGNLDDAFTMATLTNEADVDADIFHAFTEKITVVDVKGALARRFRPEQVARFGNIHLIYTSLKKSDFDELIKREVLRVCASTAKHFGITLTVSRAIEELIYRNGVFPVQGVRPVFSSVIDILEANVSRFLFEALMNDADTIAVDYDVVKKSLTGTISTAGAKKKPVVVAVPYVGRLDKVRQRNVTDVVANVSIHEAGHAVVYALLFGLAPLQLTSRVASSYAAGFTFPHEIHETRDQLLSKIQVFLAGGIAEDIIFGEGNATVGRANDREMATQIAIDVIRRYGFDAEFQAFYGLDGPYVMDKSVTDSDIEKMVSRLAAATHELLAEQRDFLVALGSALQQDGKLDAPQVAAIAAEYGVPAEVKPEGYLHLPGYSALVAAKVLSNSTKSHNPTRPPAKSVKPGKL
jgi:Peptidase family M41/ATPase family associated with various cellular activities (AAA)